MLQPKSSAGSNRFSPQVRTTQVIRKCFGDLMLTEAFYPPGTKLSVHRHEPAAFIYIVSGAYHEAFRNQSFALKRGDQLFRPANALHTDQIGESGARCFLVQFTPEWLQRVASHGPFCGDPVKIQPATIAPIVASLFREWQVQDIGTDLMIQGLAMELSAHLIRQSQAPYNRHPPIWLRRVCDYLYEHTTEKIELQALAHIAAVHPVHLCREFHRFYGLTIGQFVRKRRIEIAAERIALQDGKNLTEIAINSGFSSHAHFTTVFQKIMGIPPSRYRRICPARKRSGTASGAALKRSALF